MPPQAAAVPVFPAAEVQAGPEMAAVGASAVRYAAWIVEAVLNCPPGGLWNHGVPLAAHGLSSVSAQDGAAP